MSEYLAQATHQKELMTGVVWDNTFPPAQSDADQHRRDEAVRRMEQACDYCDPGIMFMNGEGQIFFTDKAWSLRLGRAPGKLVMRFAIVEDDADIVPPRTASLDAVKHSIRRYLDLVDLRNTAGDVDYQRREDWNRLFMHAQLSKPLVGMFHIDDREERIATAKYNPKFGPDGYVVFPALRHEVISLLGRAIFEYAHHAIVAYDEPFRREKARRVGHEAPGL